MKTSFQQLDAVEIGEAYSVFKKYMHPFIESSLGWDENFQKSGFTKKLQSDWFYWITENKQKLGLLCYRSKAASIHIHLLIIFEQFQGSGIGEEVTKYLIAEAKKVQMPVTLSCFKNNQIALNLYRKLDFQVEAEDEFFYELVSNS